MLAISANIFEFDFNIQYNAQNTKISLNFLVWKFCWNAQLPQSLERFTQNSSVTVDFHKIFIPGNHVWNYGLLCSGSDLLIFSRETYLINIFLENCKCMKCRKKGEKEKLYQSQVGKQIRFSNFNLYFVLVFNCDEYFERRLDTKTINSWNC